MVAIHSSSTTSASELFRTLSSYFGNHVGPASVGAMSSAFLVSDCLSGAPRPLPPIQDELAMEGLVGGSIQYHPMQP